MSDVIVEAYRVHLLARGRDLASEVQALEVQALEYPVLDRVGGCGSEVARSEVARLAYEARLMSGLGQKCE